MKAHLPEVSPGQGGPVGHHEKEMLPGVARMVAVPCLVVGFWGQPQDCLSCMAPAFWWELPGQN